MRLADAIYSWARLIYFLAWCTGDGVGQRPLFSIFYNDLFLVWIQSELVSLTLCSGMWSYLRLEFFSSLHRPSSCPSVGFSPWMSTKNRISLFFSTAVCLAWRLSCPWMWLRPSFCYTFSHCTLLISSVKSCSRGSCGGEKGLAQSSLATLCITRMQMSYEAIHLLEMPPWFQFDSCLQSHCVSPLLHVKEVSLWERSEGDNCT